MNPGIAVKQVACVVFCALVAAGCASPPRQAQPQVSRVGAPAITFAGSYDSDDTRLSLTANDEEILQGTFRPFTPVLNLDGTYQGQAVRAECYFASILNEKGGLLGSISGAIQSGNGRTRDECQITLDTEDAATLLFPAAP